MQKVKYIFITGGVVSSLGKGIAAASIGKLLESQGFSIALLKLDPYLNVDPGTMNPFEHGEVYVTDDRAETDLDLGHYYRFTETPLTKASNTTSGQIYDSVIKKERRGDYLGKTVQVIPHVTEEIKSRILAITEQTPSTQIVIVEIGGTVGDIESLPFLEAIRQFRIGKEQDCIHVHLTYIPYLAAAGEIKTKPTQHSVQTLRQTGIFPDFILCRCEKQLSEEIKGKIALFCNLQTEAVIECRDVEKTIYEVPLQLAEQKVDSRILSKLQLQPKKADLEEWRDFVNRAKATYSQKIRIAFVGKYVDHKDAYKSIFEALSHSAIQLGVSLEIDSLEADQLTQEDLPKLFNYNGFLVPGGFGKRGIEGKLLTAKFARENSIPYFGICLGLQILLIEFAQNRLNLLKAHSTEIDPLTPDPVISLLEEQRNIQNLGGSMRLGAYACLLTKNSRAFQAYKKEEILERHRHRWEFNNRYKEAFEKAGVLFSGTLKDGDLIEIAELEDHPWMLGVQFHPEFTSKPLQPHPLFVSFIEAAIKTSQKEELVLS